MAAEIMVLTAKPNDPAAHFEQVYRRHVHFVWRVVTRLGVPPPAVADAVQDVFLVVHRRLPDFDWCSPVKAWLAGIARGVVRNSKRRHARERRRLQVLSCAGRDPESALDARLHIGRTVAEFLDQLDEDQRMAVVLTDIEGLTPAEAAQVMGVSRNTIYSRLRLARSKLKRKLAASDTAPCREINDGHR